MIKDPEVDAPFPAPMPAVERPVESRRKHSRRKADHGFRARWRTWSRSRRALFVLGVIVALLLTVALTGALWLRALSHRLDANIERFGDPFAAIPEAERPAPASGGAVNVLLLGSDSRISAGDPNQWQAGAQRTDAIMIAHLTADKDAGYVISIPRDSWVDIPGHGNNKINAAFSFGGPTLMVKTVEQLTDVRIDHVVIADFEGFTRITDALGGVTITVPQTTGYKGSSFTAGTHQMDGETALRYVRQRHNLPGGDFDRVKRQQNWIRAVFTKMISTGTLTSPSKLTESLDALTKSVATDSGFTFGEIRGLAFSARSLRSSDVVFLTAPVKGTGRSPDGKQSIVVLDRVADAELWQAIAKDKLDTWVTEHKSDVLGRTVR
ncbi:MAG: LCP family protein [Actinomycetales bacterium]|nr:LCP family protein [Actinomycetales bacterium]